MRADIHDGQEHKTLQSKAGYIDARPHTARSPTPLATHGRTIHWVTKRRTQSERISSAVPSEPEVGNDLDHFRVGPQPDHLPGRCRPYRIASQAANVYGA